MKTITEFSASTLKNALKTRQELVTAGKTPEELPAALAEALKLEGDKLNILLAAAEAVERKSDDLKRVVVWSLQEGEVAPKGLEKKGDHYFAIEYFPPMPGQQRGRHGQDKGRGDGKGRGDRKGKGGKRGERGGRGGPRRDGQRPEGAQAGAAGDRENKPGRNFRPRGPRRDGASAGPVAQGPKGVITPKITPNIMPAATPPTDGDKPTS
jgi:hypothetical protein